MGSHHVFYFWLNLAKGQRGGVCDKEMGRMIVAVLAQYLEEHPAVTFSVPYTNEGVETFLAQVHPFVEACELPDGLAVDMALEELLYEIVDTHEAQDDSKEIETFDVRIIDKEKEFTVVVKSKGPLRNPIYKYTDE